MTTAVRTRKPAARTKRPVSADEQARRDEDRQAKVEALKADLEAAIAGLDNEERWVEYVTFVSQFGAKYSFGNQLLIMVEAERRGFVPTMVQSYGAWKELAQHEEGCKGKSLKFCGCDLNVPAGQKGLPIWGPVKRKLSAAECDEREQNGKKIARDPKGNSAHKELVGFRVDYVFDVSQLKRPQEVTVPEPLQIRRRVQTKGPEAQLLTGDDTTGALADVIALIEARGIEFAFVPPAQLNGANGNTNGKRVWVRDDVDDAQKVKTAVHELAHNLAGHVNGEFDYVQHRGRAETEAESVAYIVCGALGLDTGAYSAPYVSGWSEGKPEVIQAAGNTIMRVAKEILAALDPATEEQAA